MVRLQPVRSLKLCLRWTDEESYANEMGSPYRTMLAEHARPTSPAHPAFCFDVVAQHPPLHLLLGVSAEQIPALCSPSLLDLSA